MNKKDKDGTNSGSSALKQDEGQSNVIYGIRERFDREGLNRGTIDNEIKEKTSVDGDDTNSLEEKKLDDVSDVNDNTASTTRRSNFDHVSTTKTYNPRLDAKRISLLSKRHLLQRRRQQDQFKQTSYRDQQTQSSVTSSDRDHPPTQQSSCFLCSCQGQDHEYCAEQDLADSAAYENQPQHYYDDALNAATTFYPTRKSAPESRYYRVKYRGVVALLADPDMRSPRTGTYLGYGEIVSSSCPAIYVPAQPLQSPTNIAPTNQQLQHNNIILDSPTRSMASQPSSITSLSSIATSQTQSTTKTSPLSEQQQPPSLSSSSSPFSENKFDSNALLQQDQRHPNAVGDNHENFQDALEQSSIVIRVDQVITGGYAMDAMIPQGFSGFPLMPNSIGSDAETPKRSNNNNMLSFVPTVGPSPPYETPHETNHHFSSSTETSRGLGFLFLQRKNMQIAELMPQTPRWERGNFQYRVVSSMPLPILAGPASDAPRIKAMALPGTVHNVSLRVCFDPPDEEDEMDSNNKVWFLRLHHRRGWVADRQMIRKNSSASPRWVSVLKEISLTNGSTNVDDGSSVADDLSAVSSAASSSVLTAPGSRNRHRPPRRHRGDPIKDHTRCPIGKSVSLGHMSTPIKASCRTTGGGEHNMTPSSNVSILSDDSSVDRSVRALSVPTSPDYSQASATASSASNNRGAVSHVSRFFLMRVTAPRGLRILDTPQFQVNNLIHGNSASSSHGAGGSVVSNSLDPVSQHGKHSIFQTMAGRLGAMTASKTGNPVVFDSNSKTRLLPYGALFEASKRMESAGAYNQGAGLIKLSDGSGWAVVPRKEELEMQYNRSHHQNNGILMVGYNNSKEGEVQHYFSAFEEVGNAIIESWPLLNWDSSAGVRSTSTKWIRVTARSGVVASCPPPLQSGGDDDETSPSSSRGSSANASLSNPGGSNIGAAPSQDSESIVASSVASTFVDAMMFRTPKKNGSEVNAPTSASKQTLEENSFRIPCGMCVEVEKHIGDTAQFVRLVGGQGWVPLVISGKEVSVEVHRPDFRFGSFWFRVQAARGVKVRSGPSNKAPSIKIGDGKYFRFECGEFLRASETLTVFSKDGNPTECFAKLYRNRHALLHQGHEEYRSLQSLTVQAEWVQVFSEDELFLERCPAEPRIERHKQGWRYNVVAEDGIPIRKGPSFSAETTGGRLLGGESVVVKERVTPGGEKITWLHMKDGDGWLHDMDDEGNDVMRAHSLKHRVKSVASAPIKEGRPPPQHEIAYNTIIARLFHNDATGFHKQHHGDMQESR